MIMKFNSFYCKYTAPLENKDYLLPLSLPDALPIYGGQPRIGIRASQRDRTSGFAAEKVIAAAEDSQKLEVCRLCPKGNRAGATRCHIAGDRQGAGALVSYSGRIAGGDRKSVV